MATSAPATSFCKLHPEEGPTSVQLFGADPAIMREAAAIVAESGADLIDLNMGCPVKKVCRTGAGSAMLKEPDTAVAVAAAAREGSGLPVTVKLRPGVKPGEREGVVLAKRLGRRGRRRRDRLSPAPRQPAAQRSARLRARARRRRTISTRR